MILFYWHYFNIKSVCWSGDFTRQQPTCFDSWSFIKRHLLNRNVIRRQGTGSWTFRTRIYRTVFRWILSQISSTPPKGEGYSTKFYTGRLCPEVQTLTLLYTIFERKGTPLVGYEFYLWVFNSISYEWAHVIFCLLYKQQNQGYFSNFPKISEDFLKISEDF